ncbi:diacylglycerol kinase [Nitratireductor aestuarii]|uniref:Diacylglycerol kinase n=1 Tax=Nitratireductor aestuarii TaxID=1735103 RepID=A0A916RYX2_9HYPH|nr:cytochrome c [Nitratireductor aestuarii]GGA76209.1 diacylglycerol kinase [Nitratireductor aestuarii]
MRGVIFAGAALVVIAGAAGWLLTAASPLEASALSGLQPGEAARGEAVFWAGGCTSCHARTGVEGDAQLELGGGLALRSDFGTFVAPNISPHPTDGIGSWSELDFANAMMRGVAPDGSHYYPAFPYTSYARMSEQDVVDLFAYMKTLPQVEGRAGEHDLSFPFSVRRGVGLWKMRYFSEDPVVDLPEDADPKVLRGQYLVEGPGHCGECHTPRDFGGGHDKSQWLAGAPSMEGSGRIPNITPSKDGIGDWSESDIAYYLESGFTPDFDSAGGEMAKVVRNLAKLTAEDREAIAAYLKAVPAKP